ncbi:MAG: hypothetical protein ACHQUC_04140 [Chlamydiales bacterium]
MLSTSSAAAIPATPLLEDLFQSQPIDIIRVVKWECWTANDDCQACGNGPYQITYEVTLRLGDTKEDKYIREVCSRCMQYINTHARAGKSETAYYDEEAIKRRMEMIAEINSGN